MTRARKGAARSSPHPSRPGRGRRADGRLRQCGRGRDHGHTATWGVATPHPRRGRGRGPPRRGPVARTQARTAARTARTRRRRPRPGRTRPGTDRRGPGGPGRRPRRGGPGPWCSRTASSQAPASPGTPPGPYAAGAGRRIRLARAVAGTARRPPSPVTPRESGSLNRSGGIPCSLSTAVHRPSRISARAACRDIRGGSARGSSRVPPPPVREYRNGTAGPGRTPARRTPKQPRRRPPRHRKALRSLLRARIPGTSARPRSARRLPPGTVPWNGEEPFRRRTGSSRAPAVGRKPGIFSRSGETRGSARWVVERERFRHGR